MSEQTPQRVWFITGASTGFGNLLTARLLQSGDKVVATARKPEQIAQFAADYPETCLTLQLDVTVPEQIEAAAAAALERFGRVDVLVNNAGYGIAGGIEETTEAEFMPVFETNVFGLIRMTKALLPQFRKQRSGNIVNLSSGAGLIGAPGWGYYNATKFAVNGFSEALAAEMVPLGVYVTIVEPGPFRTDFLGRSNVEAKQQIADYAETVGKTRQYALDMANRQPGDPAKAIEAIIAAVESNDPPKHLILGSNLFHRMTARVEQWQKDLASMRETSLGADFPPEGK